MHVKNPHTTKHTYMEHTVEHTLTMQAAADNRNVHFEMLPQTCMHMHSCVHTQPYTLDCKRNQIHEQYERPLTIAV